MLRTFAILLTMSVLFSQGLSFGVKGGLNSASQDGSSESGFVFGGMMKLDAILVTADIEALYSSYGDGTSVSYLQIPATARIGLLPLPIGSVYFRGGVQYDLFLNASGDDKNTEDLFSDLAASGLSIVIGAGAELDLPILPGFIVDFRYTIPTYDFFDTSKVKDKGIDIGDIGGNFVVNQFQITAGITF